MLVTIYTDGGCRGNGSEGAIGGYGIVMMVGQYKKEYKKAFSGTTNNQMELAAVIEALEMLKYPCTVELYSDSAYVVNAMKQNWLANWKRNGWKTANKDPVKNRSMWENLDKLLQVHTVNFIKVKGHIDNEYNNRCDELANIAMDELEAKCNG